MRGLSKSRYTTFCQCEKVLWLKAYKQQEEVIEPERITRFENDNKVGDLAMGLFGPYVEVTTLNLDGSLNLDAMVAKTKEEMQKGTLVICEASFFYGNNYCAVDILRRTNDGWAIYEVKSSSDNERKTLVGTEVVAYASPEGGEKLNAKLSDKRAGTADKAWDKIVKGKDVTDPEVKSMGQDWEGFQELVQNSNIEDKDLILRVLSMYSDPAVRESEIKNMSSVYTELKSDILPELRRARFIANVEFKNYTADELIKLVDSNSDILDEPALLHAATLVKDLASKVKLYNKAIDKFDSDKARFNLGCAYLDACDLKKAAKEFANVETKDEELTNALGVLALREGDFDKATSLFKKAGTKVSKTNQGVIDILTGDYEKAVSDLKDAEGCCNNTVLAYLLTNQYDKALKAAHCKDPQVTYLKAVIAARQGNFDQVKTYLAEVAKKDKALAERALKDVEFAEYYK